MISPKDISKHRGPPAQESSQSPPERPTDFWGMIKSQRDQDKDILTTVKEMGQAETEDEEGGEGESKIDEEEYLGESPLTMTETQHLIGELITVVMTQITYLMDPENNDEVSSEQKISLLSKAAILCLNVQIDEPDGEPMRVSPIMLLVGISIVCFLPQIWNGLKGSSLWDKIPFFSKTGDKDAAPPLEEVSSNR